MKIILLLFLTACVSIIQAQEIQGIINYQLFSGGVNISVNQLMPIRNGNKKIEMQKRAYEKYNQKHPEEKRVFNEQLYTYGLRTTHSGLYAGYFRNTELLQLVSADIEVSGDNTIIRYENLLDTIKISRNNLYLGYMKRWGYGKWKIEPFLGIQTDVLRWGKDINYDKSKEFNDYWVYRLDQFEKENVKLYYYYNLYSGLRLFPCNISLKYGFDLNISKKIALNATGLLQIFKGIKNVNSPYFSGSYLSLGLRYSIINNLKR